ncbi:hypothetical protein SAMN06265365_107129 [Tistlia consotensis]|uniref:Uncharacterized protein n=1 Tax=Tistlia consotensis USBA 355 TaxID=560819 RepID=A0A1Y6B857_9PROT|nr:hypothetical protein [Tistlia consotensis]SME97982.1 hypothetical protein SAMN05428998_102131 [Tistlia consotensis USBA 355]SNR57371.1 hypothetical protein SAMN06265365_107129 [Tistlia consotensis]
MSRSHHTAPRGASAGSENPTTPFARAVFAGATVFVVTGTTICLTTGALFWGGASLVGLHGSGEAGAGLVGIVATLPLAAWLGWRAYRVEKSTTFGPSSGHRSPARRDDHAQAA